MRMAARQWWLLVLGVVVAVAALGAVTYRGIHGSAPAPARGLGGVSHMHPEDAPRTRGDGTYGIPQGMPTAPPPGDTRPKAGAEDAAAVRSILARDPALDQIGVSDARAASRNAVVHPMGGTLFSATIPLPGDDRAFDGTVPVWVGPAFGVDPPEVRQAHLRAVEVTALIAWVDVGRKQVVQIDTDGRPLAYDWIGRPPPIQPGD